MYKIILFVLPILSSHAQVRSMGNARELLKCAASLDYSCILDYVEDAADNAYANVIKEADVEARKMSIATGRAEEEQPSSILTTITNIISELPDLLRASLSAVLNGEDGDSDEKTSDGGNTKDAEEDEEEEGEDDDDDAEEENATVKSKALGDEMALCKNGTSCRGRTSKDVAGVKSKQSVTSQHSGVGRKKKKKQKLKTIIKVIAVAIVLIVKLNIFLKLLAAKLQIKFFLIAIVNLLITLARFWWELKKGHGEHPQKVIYYEHAQHQHHYDGGDDWHSSGPSESYWGRADPDDKNTAQDLAYSKQAPGGTTYSRIDNKPNFSWNPWAERSL